MPNIENDTEPDDDTAVHTRVATGGGDVLPGDTVLRASGVTKTYDSPLPFTRTVEVLTGADLELSAGEIVGIVGENGSGKSTLLKVLVGALEADGGSVERSGAVGWCPQDSLLYDRLTVAETFDLFGRAYGMDDDAIEAARDRLADRLDFERFLDYRVDHLSGGNRQKVNLAVALLHDPDVLLLDEPYTGFDWETYLAFWDLTEDLTDRGTAIAIISHFVSEREQFDRIYELADGELTEQAAEAPETPNDAGVGTGHDADGRRTDGEVPAE
jgi:ABC-type multidrug transport system ATPase subunit